MRGMCGDRTLRLGTLKRLETLKTDFIFNVKSVPFSAFARYNPSQDLRFSKNLAVRFWM